jgi:hypothetical protein
VIDYEPLLRTFARGDSRDDLGWHEGEDSALHWWVICSDTFFWATADAEPIETDAAVDELEATRVECEATGEFGAYLWPTLWVCRQRQMRPMNAWFAQVFESRNAGSPRMRSLFEAAGPPRESVFGAP